MSSREPKDDEFNFGGFDRLSKWHQTCILELWEVRRRRVGVRSHKSDRYQVALLPGTQKGADNDRVSCQAIDSPVKLSQWSETSIATLSQVSALIVSPNS